MRNFLTLIFVFGVSLFAIAQESKEVRKPKMPTDSLYQANIKRSNLYGVYIPRDVDDALNKLMELTTQEARDPLKKIHEDSVARKLFFGLGRWMEYNWNFTEGSRFSHYLRQKGLTHPDDQVKVMLVLFHRHITERPLDADNLIKKVVAERIEKTKKEIDKITVKKISNS